MEKKDILFLCQYFYPEYISSATLPFDTAKELVKAGYSVDALCGWPKEYSTDKKKLKTRETVEKIEIQRVSYIQTARNNKLGRMLNYFSFTLSILLHFFKLKKYKIIVVYSNPPLLPIIAAWAKKWFKTKFVFVAYDLYPELALVSGSIKYKSLIEILFNKINLIVYKNAEKVIALSTEMKTFIINHRLIQPDDVVVIPNWYQDEGAVDEVKENNKFYQELHNKFVVSYLGNMGTVQDIEIIIHAMTILRSDPDIHFLIAGHGNKLNWLKEVIEIESLTNVSVFDFLKGQDYLDALTISDSALITLIPNATGLCVPSKTYGYMMRGLPLLVVMDESDIVTEVKTGAGIHIRNNSPEDLASSIVYLKNHPKEQDSCRRKCREIYLAKYTKELCTKKYESLFNKIIKDNYIKNK